MPYFQNHLYKPSCFPLPLSNTNNNRIFWIVFLSFVLLYWYITKPIFFYLLFCDFLNEIFRLWLINIIAFHFSVSPCISCYVLQFKIFGSIPKYYYNRFFRFLFLSCSLAVFPNSLTCEGLPRFQINNMCLASCSILPSLILTLLYHIITRNASIIFNFPKFFNACLSSHKQEMKEQNRLYNKM